MRILTVLVCALSFVFAASSAHADRRVAFVVGNGAYKFVDPLPNPPVDAKSMAVLLRNVGFEVVEGTNLTRDQMTSRLLDFANKAQGADLAVFFYAGHGISVNGKNYLIPVDADLKSERDVMFGAAIDVDVTLDQTMSDAKVKLVLLDACRNNPFAAKIRSFSKTRAVTVSTGLSEMKSGEGTLIAFATSPGQTALDGNEGANSPFTKALLANIAQPGIEIQQAMTRVRAMVNDETHKQQLPWGHTNLIGSVYVNPGQATASQDTPKEAVVASATPSDPASPAPVSTVTRAVGSDVEIEFWRSIKDTNKPEELNAYLMNYPNGQFRPLALARLAALDAQQKTPSSSSSKVDPATFTSEATQATEDAIGLDRKKRIKVQKKLTGLGFDTKSDGKFEEGTREVITRWQTARGYTATGYFNKLQYQALMSESVSASEDEPSGERSSRSRERYSERRSSGRRYSSSGGSSGPPMINPFGGRGSPFRGGFPMPFGR